MNHGDAIQGHHRTEHMDHSAHDTIKDAAAQHSHGGHHEEPAAHNQGHSAAHAGHGGMAHDMSDPAMAAAMERDMRNRFLVALLLTVPLVLISPIGQNLFNYEPPSWFPTDWAMLALATPVVFWSGSVFITGAWHALRNRTLDMSVLIATGVLTAYIASVGLLFIGGDEVFFEAAAMLVTFVLFGHWLEMKSRKGTSDSLRALLDLVPQTATVLRNEQEVEIATADIVKGDTVVIRPGDRIPVDGQIVRGRSTIDESLVTGESMPVTKEPGDTVVGGSINQTGSFTFEATLVGSETTLARIAALVQAAQQSKAPGQRLADSAAQYLVVLAVGSGILTYVGWSIFSDVGFEMALTFAISAVVIACPDALGLATPTAVAVGTGIAARHNILIKDATTLEGLSDIDIVVLDKTGTLTEGKPALTDVVSVNGWSDDELLRLTAAAEKGSEHPLARAIIEGTLERQLSIPDPAEFDSISGKGIVATVDGKEVLAGNEKLMADYGISINSLSERHAALASEAKTPMFVAIDGQLAGLVSVADVIKPNARQAIDQFKRDGIEPVMITGDNRHTAEAVARELGIERFEAGVLPEHKAQHVAALQKEGKRVAMVGDGVNDAPALAQADSGIAIGAGTDVAIETASVVLMKSDPLDILRAIRLSSETVRKMKQNLGWASVYNIMAIPIAAGVLYPAYGIQLRPEWAALLMSVSSIIVAVNAVSLKRVEPALE
ncbi:heavy metal translocating P-type ATPase [soil metagenome]